VLNRFPREVKEEDDVEDDDEIKIAESLQFNFDTIRVATEDFSDSNKLGQGGFGAVYWVSSPVDSDTHHKKKRAIPQTYIFSG